MALVKVTVIYYNKHYLLTYQNYEILIINMNSNYTLELLLFTTGHLPVDIANASSKLNPAIPTKLKTRHSAGVILLDVSFNAVLEEILSCLPSASIRLAFVLVTRMPNLR